LVEVEAQAGDARRHVLEDGTALARVRQSLRRDLDTAGADPSVAFDCLVAVTEACTNALVHGRSDATPQVSWRIGGPVAHFVVEDYGPRRWAQGEGIDGDTDIRTGGFGLELMRSLMDSVDITVAERGTRVALAKRIR
jgi:serine/threonine-protein kinase RsbW